MSPKKVQLLVCIQTHLQQPAPLLALFFNGFLLKNTIVRLFHTTLNTHMLTQLNTDQVTWKACLQPCRLQVMQAPQAALLSLPWSSQI